MELHKPWNVIPLNLSEGLKKCDFHTHDLKGFISTPFNTDLEKTVYLIPCKQSIEHKIHLESLKLKPCAHSLNYLLGITYILQKKDVIPWGKYVIGIEPRKSNFTKEDLCVTIDFSIRHCKRLTLSYIDDFFDERFLLLAEREI